MTTEEKAKAYDEALKQAKYWLNAPQVIENWNYTVKDIIPNIFPELKESEDDKIRKALIEVAREVAQKQFFINRGTTLEDVIAYLEKQKAKERLDRMAPIYNDKESFESALEKAWKYYNESASRTVDSFEDDYIECVFSKGFREGFLYKEKQKDKMTAEEYENSELFQLKLKTKYANGYQDGLVQKEQKPAEWSEKDNIMFENIILCLKEYCLTDEIKWLKSLRPPQYCENCKLKRSVENWKPSEEQMRYLKKVYESYYFCDRERTALESLYNDLQKLL